MRVQEIKKISTKVLIEGTRNTLLVIQRLRKITLCIKLIDPDMHALSYPKWLSTRGLGPHVYQK
jgi:hypothetical protein